MTAGFIMMEPATSKSRCLALLVEAIFDGQMNSSYRRSEVDVSGRAGVRRCRVREDWTREFPEAQAMPETKTSR
jgi:hypothetical protein